MFEGYECDVYPPDGIMQDEYMANALKNHAPAFTPHLLDSDILELFSNFGNPKQFTPALRNDKLLRAEIEKNSSGAKCMAAGTSFRLDYLSWPPERKFNEAEKAVLQWLKTNQ